MRSATCLQTLHILLSFALKAARKALFLCVINSSTSRKPKYLLHSITMSLEVVLKIFIRTLVTVNENSVSIFREPYSLNWYKFLISALSSLLNGTLHYQYFGITLKLLFTTISSAFVYRHRKRIQNCTLFNLSIKISRKLFQKIYVCMRIYSHCTDFWKKVYFTR